MIVTLPIRDTSPHFAFRTELEGITYGFEFYWNTRDNGWTMNVLDVDGTMLAACRRVVVDFPLLANIVNEALPPGTLIAVDTAGQSEDPGESDLGNRVIVNYIDSTEDLT